MLCKTYFVQEFLTDAEAMLERRRGDYSKWKQTSMDLRRHLFMNDGFKPWTARPQLRMFGIPRKARVLEVLDLTYWKARSHKISGTLFEAELLGNAFVDISQNPERTYCRSDCVPVYTNSAAIYR